MAFLLEDALDSLDDGICVFDSATGLVMQANAAYWHLSGLSAAGAPGQWGDWLVSPNCQHLLGTEAAAVGQWKHTVNFAHCLPDGEVSQLQLTVRRLGSGPCCMACIKRLDHPSQPPAEATANTNSPDSGDTSNNNAAATGFTASAAEDSSLLRSAEALLGSSPQAVCVVGVPVAEPHAPLGTAAAAAAAFTAGSTGGILSSGSNLDCASFQWGAYALLPSGLAGEAEGGPAVTSLSPPSRPPGCHGHLSPQPQPALQGELGEIMYINESLSQLCGYSRQQLRSGGLGLLLRPPGGGGAVAAPSDAGVRRAVAALGHALVAGRPTRLELPCYHSSGRRVWCSVSVSAVEAAGAEVEQGEGAKAKAKAEAGWRRHTGVGYSPRGELAVSSGCGAGTGSSNSRLGSSRKRIGAGGGGDAVLSDENCSSSSASNSSSCGEGEKPGSTAGGGGDGGGVSGDYRYARGASALIADQSGSSSLSSFLGCLGGSTSSSCADGGIDASTGDGDLGLSRSITTSDICECEVAPAGHPMPGSRELRPEEPPEHQSESSTSRDWARRCQHQQKQRHHLVQRDQRQDEEHPRQQQQQEQQRVVLHERPPQQRRFVVAFHDITAQKAMLQSQQQELEKHRQRQQQEPGQQDREPLQQCRITDPRGEHRPAPVAEGPTDALAARASDALAARASEELAARLVAGGCASCRLHNFALDSLREGITIADPFLPDSPIVYTNNAFLTMTGYTREEVLGRNCRFLQGADTDPKALRTIREAMRLQQPTTVHVLNYTKGGSRFWNELRLEPVLSPASGQLVAYIGVQNDVTELLARKQSEARLRDAKEAAESATEAKSQFVANMSHEIRTPLNGMIATAQLLLASVLTPEQRELTETILESGSTLLGILGDILDFSKIDHGSLELQRRPMCLRQATEACMELVAAEAAKKGLALAYLVDDEALAQPLLGDPVRIRQVLANLLANAVKFTERGEVVVRVSLERSADCCNPQAAAEAAGPNPAPNTSGSAALRAAPRKRPVGLRGGDISGGGDDSGGCDSESTGGDITGSGGGMMVHISVADSGIGISEESTRKLFQHFRQGSEAMSRRYGGTGLGLAISKRLAQLMMGDIWVESALGVGSTFHFTLQAEWTAAEGPWPCSPSRSATSTPSHSSDCTPRTSTDEDTSGSGGTATVGAAVMDATGRWSASSPPSCSTIARLSSGSSGSGAAAREMRRSPWMADGTPIDPSGGEGAAAAADDGSGVGCAAPTAPPPPQHRVSTGGGSSTGGGGGGSAGAAEAAEERSLLFGRTVLIDVTHAATSTQVWNSCRQLGLPALQSNSCAIPLPPLPPSASPSPAAAAPPTPVPHVFSLASAAAAGSDVAAATCARPQQQPYDILVVSMDRLVPALKAGWKGRPVVALGDRELLPPALQPLVVALAVPVRHGRLATALVKATALLRWTGSNAPKLGNAPIPNESIQTLKSWRLKRGSDWEGINRRTSLDNSALERAAMMKAAATGAAAGGSKSGLGAGARGSPGHQHVPIPENAELVTFPDDYAVSPSQLPQGHQLYQPSSAPPQPQPPASTPAAAVGCPSLAAAAGCAPAVTGTPAAPESVPGGSQEHLQDLRILIAEDNKVNQKVVLKVLQQILRGCQPPDVVENGLQVLQALQKKTYDLILMDIHMPEMDGLEASKRIQETYKPEDRPRIIALSADTVQTLHDRCREAGIEAFLVKPFRIEELARVMRPGSPPPPPPRKAMEPEPSAP